MKRYAIEIKKADSALVAYLNGGMPLLEAKPKMWFVFDLDDSGVCTASKLVTPREFSRDYEIYTHAPFVARLKM